MSTSLADLITAMGQKARASSRLCASAGPAVKEKALLRLASLLEENEAAILAANATDTAAAEERGITGPRLARLRHHRRNGRRLPRTRRYAGYRRSPR